MALIICFKLIIAATFVSYTSFFFNTVVCWNFQFKSMSSLSMRVRHLSLEKLV